MTDCSLVVNNNYAVKRPSGHTAAPRGALLVNSGSITLEDSASLVQNDHDAVNIGANFNMKRNAQPICRYDYSYRPYAVEGLALHSFSPGTLADMYFGWNAATAAWVVYLDGNQAMVPANPFRRLSISGGSLATCQPHCYGKPVQSSKISRNQRPAGIKHLF